MVSGSGSHMFHTHRLSTGPVRWQALIGIVLALLVLFALAACAEEGSSPGGADGGSVGADTASGMTDIQAEEAAKEAVIDAFEGPQEDGEDNRAFGIDEDQTIQVVEQAFASQNASATWEGSVLVVSLDGDAGAPTAWMPCTAAEGIVADGESVRLVYPNGELKCEER